MYLFGRVGRLNSRKSSILLLGAIMPDFERFLPLISRYVGSLRAEQFFLKMLTEPFHSILGIVLLTVFFASFFPEENPLQMFMLLFLGGLLHLLLDMMMWPWTGGYQILFPLQGVEYTYGFRLIWPGNTTLPTLFGIPTSILLIYERMKGEKRKEVPKETDSTVVSSLPPGEP